MAQQSNTSRGFFRRLASVVSTGVVIGVCAAVLIGAVVGTRWLERRAESVGAPSQQLGEIRFIWPVAAGAKQTWLHGAFQQELSEVAHHHLDTARAAFSADPLRRVSDALAESGWFDGPPRVTRQWGGGIVIDGSWRTPAAVVRCNDKDLVVSWDGRLMPPVYEPGATTMPLISGLALPPPQRTDGTRDYANAWPGEDIAASLELLGELLRHPWAQHVAGVDASEFSRHARLVIVTDKQTRVVWGGRAAKPLVGEVPTVAKLAHLEDNVRTTGRLDGGFPMIYVNQEKRLVARPDDPTPP